MNKQQMLEQIDELKQKIEELEKEVNSPEFEGIKKGVRQKPEYGEKYYYLENSIKTNSYCPKNIEAGDIMLYGSNCLVIFYESFSTSYSYTPIGKIDNPSELSEALGAGDVEVIFEK